jgi:hypothetical protein
MNVNRTRYICLTIFRARLWVRGGVHTVNNQNTSAVRTLAPPTGVVYKHRINLLAPEFFFFFFFTPCIENVNNA